MKKLTKSEETILAIAYSMLNCSTSSNNEVISMMNALENKLNKTPMKIWNMASKHKDGTIKGLIQILKAL